MTTLLETSAPGTQPSCRSQTLGTWLRDLPWFVPLSRVATGGLEASVPEEFGHDDEVRTSAHKCCRIGVPEDMGRGVVVKAGRRGDAGDDVVGTPDAEPSAALIEEQGRNCRRPRASRPAL